MKYRIVIFCVFIAIEYSVTAQEFHHIDMGLLVKESEYHRLDC